MSILALGRKQKKREKEKIPNQRGGESKKERKFPDQRGGESKKQLNHQRESDKCNKSKEGDRKIRIEEYRYQQSG